MAVRIARQRQEGESTLQTDLGHCFLGGSDSKESACSAGDMNPIPGLERSPGEGHGYPLQHSCLENPMERGAWWAIVHGVTKSQTWLTLSLFIPAEAELSPEPRSPVLLPGLASGQNTAWGRGKGGFQRRWEVVYLFILKSVIIICIYIYPLLVKLPPIPPLQVITLFFVFFFSTMCGI